MTTHSAKIIHPTKTQSILYSHPTTPIAWVKSALVEYFREQAGITLHYKIIADTQFLCLPPTSSSEQVDGLWNHTCCEAFIAESYGDGYRELNLSPGGQWQLYRFISYREGRVPMDVPPPQITPLLESDRFMLTAHIPNSWLPQTQGLRLRLGLSVVLEDHDNKLYFLALSHPPGVPNFHCADAWLGTL